MGVKGNSMKCLYQAVLPFPLPLGILRLSSTVLIAEKRIETLSSAHYEIHLSDPETLMTLVKHMRAFKQNGHSVVTVVQFITEPQPSFARKFITQRPQKCASVTHRYALRSKTFRCTTKKSLQE